MKNVLHSHPGAQRFGWNRRKFTSGELISVPSGVRECLLKGEWIYVGSTPKHASIVYNMSLATVFGMISRKSLRVAIRAPEFPYVFKAEWMASYSDAVDSCYWVKCSEIPAVRGEHLTRQATLQGCIKIARAHTGRDDVRVTVEFDN